MQEAALLREFLEQYYLLIVALFAAMIFVAIYVYIAGPTPNTPSVPNTLNTGMILFWDRTLNRY